MSALVKNILESRAQLWEQAKASLDVAETEGRALTVEEQAAFDKLTGEIDRLDTQRKTVEDQQQRAARANDALQNLGVKPGGTGTPGGGSDLESDLRSFLKGEKRSLDLGRSKSLTINARALKEAAKDTGGATVPDTFVDQLYVHLVEMSAILDSGATVLTTTSGEPIVIPKTKTFGTKPVVTAEGAKIAKREPTFDQLRLSAYKYAEIVQISRELIDDTAVDLLGFIAQEAGWALGNALGEKLLTGSGTGEPAGLLGTVTVGKTGAAAAPTYDDLIDLEYSVIAPYRKRPSTGWLMADTTVAAVRKLKDNDGQYLWQPSLVLGQPDSLSGYPLLTDPYVEAAAAGKKSVLFGAFSAYYVRLAGGLRFERSDDFAFDEDLVTFKAVIRGDGGLIDEHGAIKAFVGHA